MAHPTATVAFPAPSNASRITELLSLGA